MIFTFFMNGCKDKEMTLYKASSFDSGFDTVIYLNAYMESEEEFNQIFELTKKEFTYYNALFDKYHTYEGINNIKTINDNAGIQPVKVNEDIIELLLLSRQYSQLSHNQFDITMGPVLKIWHNVRELANQDEPITLPSQEELQKAYACTGWDKVEINEEESTVYLNNSCASLDVGSVAKGFATEKTSQMLIDHGLTSGIVNAGGNVRTIGSKLGKDWVAGIQTPEIYNLSEYILTLPIHENLSLVTSGNYQRYFIHEDEIYHHIIDPSTLYPARHADSISILAEDSGIADICSTMLYTLSYEDGKALVDHLDKQGVHINVVWVYKSMDEIMEYKEDILEIGNYYILATEDIKNLLEPAK